MNKGIAWMDGRYIALDAARIPLLSHALHYGTAVYEGIRAYETPDGPAIFRLHDHINRLFRSAQALGITIPYSQSILERTIQAVLKKNDLKDGYIRPLVFYGEGQMTLFPRGAKIHCAIAAWPWPAYLGHSLLSICVSPYIRFYPKSIVSEAKISGLYAVSTVATIDARKRGFNECIMLDHQKNIAEGPGENIFIVRHGKLYTPNSSSILRGVTRATVMTIARNLRIPVLEKQISLRELLTADEAFFTGTATEIAIIKKVNQKNIGTGKFPMSEQIREMYLAAVHGKIPKYEQWLTRI